MYFKEQGYDSQWVPAVQGFKQGCDEWKVIVPTISRSWGGQWLQMADA